MSTSEGIILSDDELAVLATLAYFEQGGEGGPLSSDGYARLWNGEFENRNLTLGQILDRIVREPMMAELRGSSAHLQDANYISGAEWAAVIDEVRNNPNLANLTLVDIDSNTAAGSRAFTLTSGSFTYIGFRGTGANDTATEWPDNFQLLYLSDTPAQLAALNYVNFINNRYGGAITVFGHSKGANKSMYVTVRSPYITRCVTFDGQGFSSEFLLRYGHLLDARSPLITAYSTEADFVNGILYPIAGSQYFMERYGVDSYAKNHSPIAFFDTENGSFSLQAGDRTDASLLISDLSLFMLDSVPDRYLPQVGNFLGTFVDCIFNENSNNLDLLAVIAGDPRGFGATLAVLLRYPDLEALLKAIASDANPQVGTALTAYSLLRAMTSPLAFVQALCPSYFDIALTGYGLTLSLFLELASALGHDEAWAHQAYESYKETYAAVGPGNGSLQSALGLSSARTIVRDFSDEKKNEFMAIVDEINSELFIDPTRWDVWYRAESWYGRLSIDNYLYHMNEYFRKVMDVNNTSRNDIEKIFRRVKEEDRRFSSELFEMAAEIENASLQLRTIFSNAHE